MSLSALSKYGSQDGADRAFEFLDPRVRRHPARFEVQCRDAVVVALEEREEILREIVLVEVGERADDPEIQRDIAPEGRFGDADLDVARVHVRMKEPIAEHLREKDLDPFARKPRDVHAGRAEGSRSG